MTSHSGAQPYPMLAVRDHLLSSACSLLACDATAVVGRLNHALSDLVHLGLADYVWLTVFDDGIARVIHSANCPALTSELQELVHRRSAAYIENMPPKLRAISNADKGAWPQEICADIRLLTPSACGGLFLGWVDEQNGSVIDTETMGSLNEWARGLLHCWHNTFKTSAEPTTASMTRISSERSNTIFNLINDAAGDLITVHDTAVQCLYASEASQHILGLAPEELIGRTPFEFVHPDDHGHVRNALEAMIDHGVSQSIEVRARDAAGGYRWVEAKTACVRNSDGKFQEIVTVIRDISERREYEQAISFNEQILRAVIDNIPDASWLKDSNGILLFVNPAAERLFNHDADELIGLTEIELLPQSHQHQASEYDQLVYLTGRPTSYTLRYLDKHDQELTLEVTKGPVLDESGQIIGITATARDVTMRIQEHLELVKASLLVGSAETIAPVGIWSYQEKGDTMIWNDRMYQLHGLTRDAFVPTWEKQMATICESDRQNVISAIAASRDNRSCFRLDFVICLPDGSQRQATTMGAPFFNAAGELREIAGVITTADLNDLSFVQH